MEDEYLIVVVILLLMGLNDVEEIEVFGLVFIYEEDEEEKVVVG